MSVVTVSWRQSAAWSKRHLNEKLQPFQTLCGLAVPSGRYISVQRDKIAVETELCASCLRILAKQEAK